MAEQWKHPSFQTLEGWLEAIRTEASDKLNDWETNFIEDMTIKITNKWYLTESQVNKLESIYAEKTS